MATAQNNLIVIPGGMLKCRAIKVSAAQHRRIKRFCKSSGWTEQQAIGRMLNNFMNDEAPIWEQKSQRA